MEAEFERMLRIVCSHTMVTKSALRSLYDQLVFCEASVLPGDYVECGVWKGGAVGLMALVNLTHGKLRRHIHLFDSFDDICEPDASIDGERAVREVRMWSEKGEAKGRLVPLKGIYDRKGGHGTIEECSALLAKIGYDANHLYFHKGWFQQTLPEAHASIEKIAILRLDADWYASTKVCLEYLFNKVVPGGFVIFDDYGAYEGCAKAVDEFLLPLSNRYYLNYVNQDCRYLIVR
jgi:hypothetical protein